MPWSAGHITLRMFSCKVHIFVNLLNAGHVSSCIVSELESLSSADMLGAPVKVSEIYRTSYLLCNGMETCLPSLHRLACSFGSDCKMNDIARFHLPYYAENQCGSIFPVNRKSTELTEQPSERAPEELLFYHAIGSASD